MTRKKYITILILAVFLAAFLWPGMALGATGYKIVGESNGLVIASPDAPEKTGNLNPGDLKNSRLQLTNTGSASLTVSIRTEITGEKPGPNKGKLSEVLWLTIKDGDNTITDTTFRQADDQGNVSLGTMAPGSTKTLHFSAKLPEGTDNDYQGSSLKAIWVFTTVSSGGGGGGGGSYTVQGDDEEEPEEIIVPEEPEVQVPEEPDEGITVPSDDPKMPGTGIASPLPYYAAGSVVILAGFLLTRKKK